MTVTYADTVALGDLDLTLQPGISALVGPNGAGKSTLLRVAAGVQRPQRGTIRFAGARLDRHSWRRYQRKLGYLPQAPSWHSWMTVRDTVEMFAWMHGLPRTNISESVAKTLDAVGLTAQQGTPGGQLSGGQFQRLMLATVIVHDPVVLLLDEPTVGLDPEQKQQFREVLARAGEDRVVLISTHMMDDVATLASRLLVVNSGKVVFDGPGSTLADQYAAVRHPNSTELESAYINLIRDHESPVS